MTAPPYPPRPTSQIMPTTVTIGGVEGLGESIPCEGHLWLVLQWSKPSDGEWMQPRRLVCLAGVEHRVEQGARPRIVVTQPLPADAMPPHDPIETAKLTAVQDFPQIVFDLQAANSR